MKALAHRTKEAGGDLLDAPVSGSQVSLAQGKLLIMVGGDPDVLERALALGREVGVPLPTTDTTNTWLTAAHGQGLSHHDFSIL